MAIDLNDEEAVTYAREGCKLLARVLLSGRQVVHLTPRQLHMLYSGFPTSPQDMFRLMGIDVKRAIGGLEKMVAESGVELEEVVKDEEASEDKA